MTGDVMSHGLERVRKTARDDGGLRNLLGEYNNVQRIQAAFGCANDGDGCAQTTSCCGRFPTARWQPPSSLILRPRGLSLSEVLKLKPGESLPDCKTAKAPLSWVDLKLLLGDVVEAVLCLHRKRLSHGDVKPGNVIVHCCGGSDGVERFRAVLIDLEGVTDVQLDLQGVQPLKAGFTPAYASKTRMLGLGNPYNEDAVSVLLTLRAVLKKWLNLHPSDEEAQRLNTFVLRHANDDATAAVLHSLATFLSGGALEEPAPAESAESAAPPAASKEPAASSQRLGCVSSNARKLDERGSSALLTETLRANPEVEALYRSDPVGCKPCPKDSPLGGRCVVRTSPDNCRFAFIPPRPLAPNDVAKAAACALWDRSHRDERWQREAMAAGSDGSDGDDIVERRQAAVHSG
jgi:hypothetical protein